MTSTFPDTTISTDRLVLRPFEEDDVPALVEMMNDESVTAWTPAAHPYTTRDARTWITTLAPAERTEGRGIVFAVTEFLTQRLVGSLHLRNTDWHCRSTQARYVSVATPRAALRAANAPIRRRPNARPSNRGR